MRERDFIMTAAVESMMYVGDVPWHGLGTYVGDEPVVSQEAIIQAGLNWDVKKVPISMSPNGYAQEIDSHVAMIRETDKSFYGIVGKGYEPVQNLGAFKFMDGLIEDGSMRYHTAGSLRDGRNVWLLGKVGTAEIVPDDKVDHYLMLWNSHDGSSALRVFFTTVRVVCANTAQVALREGKGQGVSLRHTANIRNRLAQSREVLQLGIKAFEQHTDFAKHLASVSLDVAKWTDFVTTLIPDPIEGASERSLSIVRNKRDKIEELFLTGRGNAMNGVKGTAWAAQNAVVEYQNYHRLGENVKERGEKQFEASLFGSGAQMIKKANELLLVA